MNEEPVSLEYRVKFELGGKGGSSAYYGQSPAAVRKIIAGCRKRGQRILAIQSREVGEWAEPLDDSDLTAMFDVEALPPDWARICPGPDDRFSFAWGHASRFPGLTSGSPEHTEFVAQCVAAIEAGDHLPDWHRIGGPL